MTDLKEYLSPITKSLISKNDLSYEGVAFNWFFQKMKQKNIHNRLINRAEIFEELIEYADDYGHWEDLLYEIGFKSDSSSFSEEIIKATGLNVNETFVEIFESISNVIDEISCDNDEENADFIKTLYSMQEKGYESILKIENETILMDTLKLFDSRNIKYVKYDYDTYFIDSYIWSNVNYFKISGENAEAISYFWYSVNQMTGYINDNGTIYLSVEYPVDEAGYGEAHLPVDMLSRLIYVGFIELSDSDIVNYDELIKENKLKKFFNSIKINETMEVIF